MSMSMEATLKHHLTLTTSVYATATGRSASTVGNLALNDGGLFKRIDDGAAFKVRTYDAVMSWLSTNWPPDTEWPEGVPRPPRDLAMLTQHARGPTPLLKKRMTSAGLLYKSA
jgi:hypothetical protein